MLSVNKFNANTLSALLHQVWPKFNIQCEQWTMKPMLLQLLWPLFKQLQVKVYKDLFQSMQKIMEHQECNQFKEIQDSNNSHINSNKCSNNMLTNNHNNNHNGNKKTKDSNSSIIQIPIQNNIRKAIILNRNRINRTIKENNQLC